ncbi:hypothetical protein ACLMJK_007583 [Lecanora helva]
MKTSTTYSFLALVALASANPRWHSKSQSYGAETGKSYAPSRTYSYQPSYTGDATGAQGTGSPSNYGASGTGSSPGPISTGGSSAPGNETVSSGGISLPAGCATKNGVGIGWLPDSDKGVPLNAITSTLNNEKPCFVGYYAQITSSSWDGSQLTGKIEEAKAGGAPYPIFVASVMPYIPMSEVPNAAGSITTVMKKLTDAGFTVWLRFAHEMNWYDSAAAGYVYPQSSVADYQKAWAAVSQAVASNPNVKMFWSPNSATAADLKNAGWYPTSGAVDVIGVDIYPKGQKSFSDVYQSFCSGWDVPFAIGETGIGPASADKTYWLQQLTSTDAKAACPNYIGFSYFEYDKEEDFRVATDGHTEAVGVLKG